jgi:DNA topoisomerase-2
MSFVNSIATTKGGRHVDHVSKIIENSLAETLKKKNKGGIVIKPHQVSPFSALRLRCRLLSRP